MNYRHNFHAGNFADVMKHALLVALVRGLQRKERGFLYLDTHAGRGGYDLSMAAQGDSLVRTPEWPEGVGRLWAASDLPAELRDYIDSVRQFDRRAGNIEETARFYPGSPWIVRSLVRPQDRMVLCEQQPAECAALRAEFAGDPQVKVQEADGYGAPRAWLPPAERRALVLIDPPFEAQGEFRRMTTAVSEGLERLPAGVFALWYPLTERARVDAFFASLREMVLPPTLALELVVDPDAPKMKGCGLVVINPPWQFERTTRPTLATLAALLGRSHRATAETIWLVRET